MDPFVHPVIIHRWKRAHLEGACGIPLGCGLGSERHSYSTRGVASEPTGGFGSGPFGVRRPLRFLTYKLGLSEAQVTEMASILNDLKTERAQAAVDDRRTLTAFADALAGESFGETQANGGAELRRKSAEHLAEAVVRALGRIHKILDAGQRERLAYLIRSGALAL